VKVLRLTTAYPSYLRQFYEKRPHLKQAGYTEQLKQLNADGFGWADFWQSALGPLGYEVRDIVANAEPLQRAWASEQGFEPSVERWLLDIAEAQVRKFAPDVLFMDDYASFPAAWVRALRDRHRSIRLVLGWCGAPYDDESIFREYDVVLSCIPELVAEFERQGHKAVHLNHAFHPRMAVGLSMAERDIPVSFVGQLIAGKDAHIQRIEILTALAKEVDVRIHSPQAPDTRGRGMFPYALKSLIRVSWYHAFWTLHRGGLPVSRLPFFRRPIAWNPRPRLAMNARPPIKGMRPAVFGRDMFAVLGRSTVTFNSHIDLSRHSASNMRLFEATGMGACLVTDWKQNLHTLFEPDVEVVTYRNAAECIEKIRWLIRHPKQSADIAAAGRRRTLSSHTFAHRAPELDAIIRRYLH